LCKLFIFHSLVAVKGSEDLTKQAAGILQQFEPENIQGYTIFLKL
jgi:hypothetical protein